MTSDAASTEPAPGNRWRSVRAVLAGTLAVIVLSLVTDEILHVLHVYPPWSDKMPEPGLNALALSYRCLFNVVGATVTARLAPRNPIFHLWVFGFIGLALGTLAAIVTVPLHLGPSWYPILLAASALPCTWLGAVFHRSRVAPG